MTDKITLGAGCFWGIQAMYDKQPGVTNTSVGYMGGDTLNPTYKDVCTGQTRHAEVVQVEFDAQQISLEKVLDLFWDNHNPTTLNRQGPDRGTQYRSAIFYHTQAQADIAHQSKQAIQDSGKFTDTVVTEIVPAQDYWMAEDYHQHYIAKRGF